MESGTEFDMTCAEFWSVMPELEAASQEWEHARECASCGRLLERQRALERGLQTLAHGEKGLQAPARLEDTLLAAFRSSHEAPTPRAVRRHWVPAWNWAPLAAAVAGLALFLAWNIPLREAPRTAVGAAAVDVADAAASDADFIPLPYAPDKLASEDGDRVQVQLSRSTLIAWGIPIADEAGGPVEAELLLGAGGAPEAVRLLQ